MRAVMTCNAHLIIHPFVGFSIHPGFFPPYAMVNPQTPSIDFSLLGGFFLGSLPTTSITDPSKPAILGPLNQALIARQSDAGFVVPHIHLGLQFDWLQIVSTILASSKNLMGARSVQVRTYDLFFGEDESAIGTCLFPGPISLNLACYGSPFPMPSDVVVAPNTIRVGVSLLDILIALVSFIIEVAMAMVMNKMSSGKWMGKSNLKPGRNAVIFHTGKWFRTKLVGKAIGKALGKAGSKFGKRYARAEYQEDIEQKIFDDTGLSDKLEEWDDRMRGEGAQNNQAHGQGMESQRAQSERAQGQRAQSQQAQGQQAQSQGLRRDGGERSVLASEASIPQSSRAPSGSPRTNLARSDPALDPVPSDPSESFRGTPKAPFEDLPVIEQIEIMNDELAVGTPADLESFCREFSCDALGPEFVEPKWEAAKSLVADSFGHGSMPIDGSFWDGAWEINAAE